MMVPSVEMRQV
jgi:hypothetical protein